jgi:SAM domain (Sterile alpha motif)
MICLHCFLLSQADAAKAVPRYLSAEGVATGLQAERLGEYAPTIMANRVDSTAAALLTEDDLRTELGVASLGDRRKLMVYLKRVATAADEQ